MTHPADARDTADTVATFEATQAELTLRLASGDITAGPGTEIRYDHGQFLISTRASQGGLTTLPRALTADELRTLLSALQQEQQHPPASLDLTALEIGIHLLAQAVAHHVSKRLDNARFADITRDTSGAIMAHLGLGVDMVGTVHDARETITFEQHVVPLPPSPFRHLSAADRASLAAALSQFIATAPSPVDPLWQQLLEDVQREGREPHR